MFFSAGYAYLINDWWASGLVYVPPENVTTLCFIDLVKAHGMFSHLCMTGCFAMLCKVKHLLNQKYSNNNVVKKNITI